jgi:proteasome beta subunit
MVLFKSFNNIRLKGTTTVSIICKNSVIMAADKQSTALYVSSRMEKKVYKLDDHLGITIAGLVADAHYLIRILRAEASLFKLRRQAEMQVKTMATVLSNIMHSNRIFPYFTQLLVGGYDNSGAGLFSVDPYGGLSSGESYYSTGSGSPLAYGILESEYQPNIGYKDGIKLAFKILTSVRKRDVYTGGLDFDIVYIDKTGYHEVDTSEIT